MRFTPQLFEAVGAQMPSFHRATRPLDLAATDQIEVPSTAILEDGDLSTNVANEVPLLACYRLLLKQAKDGRRRAQIIRNNRLSYYSEAAIECRAA